MGKRGRKTRWRTLTIADEQSDSEESNRDVKNYHHSSQHHHHHHSNHHYNHIQKSSNSAYYNNRFTYSSQSTPTRRYQCDNNNKSTRSSSTASENKITFNEDEYTRITTPRQDVLFKKGYLNKPKTYQTQTSTGTSTTNSTGNGTPDHQSTDLEYESQFVFPNGFVDQNGIYYVNSFESYPLMVYPPAYYQEISSSAKSKRDSTGSLTGESSPNNEEAASQQDFSESSANFNNHVYNVIYPGFYINGACQPQDLEESEADRQEQHQRVKKRRRRKHSQSSLKQDDDSKTTSEDDDQNEEETDSSQDNASKIQQTTTQDAQTLLLNGIEQKPNEEHDNNDADDEDDKKYDLKPDAEEFVPRAYRFHHQIPPNFLAAVPILNPLTGGAGEYNAAFIPPPGLHPISLIPQNFINFIPNYSDDKSSSVEETNEDEQEHQEENKETEIVEKVTEKLEDEVKAVEVPRNQIDIAKIVSKLEEAAKEQQENNVVAPPVVQKSVQSSPTRTYNIQKSRRSNSNNNNAQTAWKTPVNSPKRDHKTNSVPFTPKSTLRNYSETLKTPTCEPSRVVPQILVKSIEKKPGKEVAEKRIEAAAASTTTKLPNQWISVSNRKNKRKNRNVEEDFEETEASAQIKDEEFESYDVNLLEDVVVTTADPEPIVKMLEVSEIEKELISKVPEEQEKEVTEEEVKKPPRQATHKKKTKKSAQKSITTTTKRVIIKDIDLSDKLEEVVKQPEVVKIEEVKEEAIVVLEHEEKEEEKLILVEEVRVEQPAPPAEKKSKKKKKKKSQSAAAATLVDSESSSNTTLNLIDETSYDFLLETSVLDESQTNVEISQELDKMIQRGMYNNLEEKIKSLNSETMNDGFFKTIIKTMSRETSVEKTPNTTDLGEIFLKSANQLLKPKAVILEPVRANLKQLGSGDFLGETSSPASSGKTSSENNNISGVGSFKKNENDGTRDELYPITKAVKEWMTRTRETTPDVEILKSPSTILKEFSQIRSNSDDDDEMTVYAFSREGSNDLLECWENDELTAIVEKPAAERISKSDEDVMAPSSATESEHELGNHKNDEVIEVYESQYGRNEDFLKIQNEIKQNNAFPKHGNLPYRAICCSIM